MVLHLYIEWKFWIILTQIYFGWNIWRVVAPGELNTRINILKWNIRNKWIKNYSKYDTSSWKTSLILNSIQTGKHIRSIELHRIHLKHKELSEKNCFKMLFVRNKLFNQEWVKIISFPSNNEVIKREMCFEKNSGWGAMCRKRENILSWKRHS